MSAYGSQPQPHPAVGILRQRRMTNRRVAELLSVSPGWVGAVLLGHVRASQNFRIGLSELLELPEAELFHDEPPRLRYPGDTIILD